MTVNHDYTPYSYFPAGDMLPESIPWMFLADTDLTVVDVTGTVLVAGVDYEISGDGPAKAGIITTLRIFDAEDEITISRNSQLRQQLALPANQPVPSSQYERELDRRALIEQEQDVDIDDVTTRALRVPAGEDALPVESLAAADGKILAVINDGGVRKIKAIDNDPAAIEQNVTDAENAAAATAADRIVVAADKAIVAADKATVAADKATTQGYRDEAALSAAASIVSSGIYADAATGRAAVANGVYYVAVAATTANAITIWRRDDSSNSTEFQSYPSVIGLFSEAIKIADYEVGRSRVQYRTADRALLEPLDLPTAWNLNGNTLNADGTITIAAGSYIETKEYTGNAGIDPEVALPATVVSLYISETVPREGADAALVGTGYFNQNFANLLPHQTFVEKYNGVYAGTFRNSTLDGSNKYNYARFRVANPRGDAVTIFPSFVTLQSFGDLLPAISNYQAQEIADQFGEMRFDAWWANRPKPVNIISRRIAEKSITKAADGVAGDNGNAGTSIRGAKANIENLPPLVTGDTVGFRRGAVYFETLIGRAATGYHDIDIRDFALGKQGDPFPEISPLLTIVDGSWTDLGSSKYSFEFSVDDTALPSDDLENDGYEFVYVEERDTNMTEAPIAARRRMTQVASSGALVAGASFIENLGGGNWRATIWPTDSAAPGTLYTYSVAVRRYTISMFNVSFDEASPRSLQGLTLVAPNDGYGVGLPKSSLVDRCVFIHSAAHSLTIGSGVVSDTLFYTTVTGANPLVFYSVSGAGLNWRQSGNLFIGKSANSYAHTSSGASSLFIEGSVEDCAAIGVQTGNALIGTAFTAANTEYLEVTGLYVKDQLMPYRFLPITAESVDEARVKKSLFRNVARCSMVRELSDTVWQMRNGADSSSVDRQGISVDGMDYADATWDRHNNLYVYRYQDFSVGSVDNRINILGVNPKGKHNRNIYIVEDMPDMRYAQHTYNVGLLNNGLLVDEADYNLFVLVARAGVTPSGTFQLVRDGSSGKSGFYRVRDYLRTLATPRETNSLFIDARNDPRGVDAVLRDVTNGDFRWADTPLGASCARWCIANEVGPVAVPHRWPEVPTVDDAAKRLYAL